MASTPLSFDEYILGNQIDYSGAVRIRRETINRHIEKMKGERGKFVRRMGAVCNGDTSTLKGKLTAGRLAGICKRYCTRLVAKGIGFMKAGAIPKDSRGGRNNAQGYCNVAKSLSSVSIWLG